MAKKKGMLLGVMEKNNIKGNQINMAAGGEIVMYTDGIAEIKSREGEYFDEEHLHNMLNAHKRSSSARLI